MKKLNEKIFIRFLFLFILFAPFFSTGITLTAERYSDSYLSNVEKHSRRYTELPTGNGKDNLEQLKKNIDSIISGIDCDISIQVISAARYDAFYTLRPTVKMIPASITKVITAATALNLLGANYQFNTVIYTDDNKISNGIIDGNLYLKGYGDPELSTADVMNLAKVIAGKNIKEITGNIVYDDSFLDNQHYGLADVYKSDTKKRYWPYICALSLDKNQSKGDPALEAAKLLNDELIKYNIKIGGIIIAGTTPDISKELARNSRSLPEVLIKMNKMSDNQTAITLFKVAGANFAGIPGTLKKGQDAVIDFLSSIGIDRDNYEILEGSGLTRYNYVTSNLYIQLLKYMYDKEKLFDYFFNSLPIGGVDGTLKDRMKQTEAEKNIHAKTGTINNVSTLTGYAISRENELIIFYIAMNGFGGNSKPYRDRQDYICDAICRFTRK